ncbi:MAG: hypothetical protein AAFP77_14025 [Bacteroidota bacterium]
MRHKHCLLFLLIVLGLGALEAQEEEYRIFRKIANGQLYVRWMPLPLEAFQHAIDGNMQLEVYAVEGSDIRPTLTLLDQQPLQPLTYTGWRNQLLPSTWDTLAITSVYGREMDADFLLETFLAPEYEDTEESAWLHRHQFSNYGLGYLWPAIERSGLGYTRPLDPEVELYALKVFPTPSGDTIWIDFDINNWQDPKVPELDATFKDRRVELQWRTLEYRNDFFGWELERSFDEGQTWEQTFELPIINDNDTIAGAGEALKFLYYEDVLPENDVPVIYRLRGADFLGGLSVNESRITGEGKEDIRHSPLLTKTIQTDSNHAVIQWEFDPEKEFLLREFRIVETDSAGHNYRLALDNISPQAREVSVPMKFRSNFFRVQAVSHQGTVLSSFESLVMAYDVTPPAIPRDFTGTIDSNGIVRLNWITSNEPDLLGYYLFKGYYKDRELAMITADALPGPAHTDTVDMETGNDWVYYQLRSVDTRGNGSPFTPVLALKKPDVFPPEPSQFTKVDNDGRQVTLEWTTSPAPDAQTFELYRREMENEDDFALIYRFDIADFVSSYVDSLVQPNLTYAYTMLVVDDDGLESEPSQPVSLRLKDFGVRSPIDNFLGQPLPDENSIELQWVYSEAPREYYLYRGTDDDPPSLLKVLPGEQLSYSDLRVRTGSRYRYILQAIFEDGDTSPYTDVLVVELE